MLHGLNRLVRLGIDRLASTVLLSGLGKARFGVPRLYGAHLNAKVPGLVPQGQGQSVHGSLAGGVKGLVRDSDGRGNRAGADDPPSALGSHHRQHRSGTVELSQEVHVHDPPGVAGVGELHRARDTHTRVVDQQVDPSFPVRHLLHGSLHRRRV